MSQYKIRNENLQYLRKEYLCKIDTMFPIYSIDILVPLIEQPLDIPGTSLHLAPCWLGGTESEGGSKDEAKMVDRDQITQNLVGHEKESMLYF